MEKDIINREQFSRTELLLGNNAIEILSKKRVAVFGIGGVGGYVVEALVRSGVGNFDIVDNDIVCLSNINRQIIASFCSIGKYKTEVMKSRMLDINPSVTVYERRCFFLPENSDEFPFEEYDYIVDAVDTVTAKLAIVTRAKELNIPVISAMGAGNKLNPEMFKVADIKDTKICPLARVMRRELRKRGIDSLKVVYSEEEPVKSEVSGLTSKTDKLTEGCQDSKTGNSSYSRPVPGSVAFVPSVMGLIIAGEVIKDLLK